MTICHHSSKAKLPKDEWDFAQMTTISVQTNTALLVASQATFKQNNSSNLWKVVVNLT